MKNSHILLPEKYTNNGMFICFYPLYFNISNNDAHQGYKMDQYRKNLALLCRMERAVVIVISKKTGIGVEILIAIQTIEIKIGITRKMLVYV
jgi:hypothetical protein